MFWRQFFFTARGGYAIRADISGVSRKITKTRPKKGAEKSKHPVFRAPKRLCRNLCRPYGTRSHFASYPALKRWAKLFRPIWGWFLGARFQRRRSIRVRETISEGRLCRYPSLLFLGGVVLHVSRDPRV